eukprot:9010063-Pyramimonas_sp.AAC.1
MALLWAVFNITGTMVAMERFLMEVRSVTTDFGTESVIVNIPNCFRELAARMSWRPSPSQSDQAYLFPLALIVVDLAA